MLARRVARCITPLLVILLGGCTPHLQPSDLAAAPVRYRADTMDILRDLGQPAHRERQDYGSLGSLTTWYYPHVVLTVQSGPWCDQIRLLDSTVSTARGVRVGDQLATVLRVYGRPAGRRSSGDSLWIWYDGPQMRVALKFFAVRDTVRTITIGQQSFVFM